MKCLEVADNQKSTKEHAAEIPTADDFQIKRYHVAPENYQTEIKKILDPKNISNVS